MCECLSSLDEGMPLVRVDGPLYDEVVERVIPCFVVVFCYGSVMDGGRYSFPRIHTVPTVLSFH